jgi:hypothetical protein
LDKDPESFQTISVDSLPLDWLSPVEESNRSMCESGKSRRMTEVSLLVAVKDQLRRQGQ